MSISWEEREKNLITQRKCRKAALGADGACSLGGGGDLVRVRLQKRAESLWGRGKDRRV